MKKLLCLTLLLAGCAQPAVKVETVEVKVPVAVQPITRDQIPNPPTPLGPRPKNLSAAADLLLSKWCSAVAYFVRADMLLRASAKAPSQGFPRYPECESR